MSGELFQAGQLVPLLDDMTEPVPEGAPSGDPANDPSRQERLATLGRFVTSIAHDLNNMLTVIVGAADELQAVAPSNAALRDLSASVAHGAALVQQLMQFARQRPALPPQSLLLADELERLLPLLVRMAGPGITIRYIAPAFRPLVRIERTALGQALLNVVSNARDAMSGGGTITLSLLTCALVPGGGVGLLVEDTGRGMTAEMFEELRKPFATTRADSGGTGVGLATVDTVVQAAGGGIRVRGIAGVGTRICLRFPEISM